MECKEPEKSIRSNEKKYKTLRYKAKINEISEEVKIKRTNSLKNNENKRSKNKNKNKIIDPNFLVYNSTYLRPKNINYNGLCNDLKILEIELHVKNRIRNSKSLNINEELEQEISMMKEKSELNDFGYDFYNIQEIFKIVEIVKKAPEKRTMFDLLKVVKYLTTTKLGNYFKQEFENKKVFEKLVTFCGVEMKYKFFKKGETIFKIGDVPDFFYMILYGKVDILKPLSKKVVLSGYEYFCFLMDLKRSNENHLFYLCIQDNISHFYIQKEEAHLLNYIYILIIIDKISRHMQVDFPNALKITGVTCEELDLVPSQLSSAKYLLENTKKIKKNLPAIPGATVHKYLFLDERINKKNVIIYEYFKFLTIESKHHFGDSSMDSNTTRNATLIAVEDTYTAYISNNLYYKNVVAEKAAIIDRKIQFLNSNFIFSKINLKKFERKYFGWFICNNYRKGDLLFNEGDSSYYTYFIEKGEVELYSSKNVLEFEKVIEHLEKERNDFAKRKNLEKSDETTLTYDKIKFSGSELKERINKKEKNKIFLLKDSEDIGLLSFYFGYPYLTSGVVSSQSAKIYKIDNKYLSEILLREKECYIDLINRIENKLALFHERFFNINNTKLLLADHKSMIENKEREENLSKMESSAHSPNNKLIIKNILNNNSNNVNQNAYMTIKNNFNKNDLKINYDKLKEIFNKTLSVNKSYDMNNFTINEHNLKNSILNGSLPLIKSNSVKSHHNSIEKRKSVKSRSMEDLKKSIKYNSQMNIILSQKEMKRIFPRKRIGILRYKSKDNFLKYQMKVFNEKSPYFLNQTNYCIDPVLKENCANLENIQRKNNINMKNSNNIKFQNKKIEESTMKTNYLFNLNLNIKSKNVRSLHKIKPNYNDYYNISKSCKSFSIRNDKINVNNTKDDNIINITIDNDELTKKRDRKSSKYIDHPYYAPIVLTKKEKYKIFTGEDYFNPQLNFIKLRRKEINKKKGLNEFGYPLNSVQRFNESMSYKNEFFKRKINGI